MHAPGRSMRTPATPLRMLFAVALLALYTCFCGWIALTEHNWILVPVTLLAGTACVAAARLRPWSQWLVYLLTAAFVGVWARSLYESYRVGFFHFVHGTQIVRFLAPDIVMVLLALFCSYAVFTNFRRR